MSKRIICLASAACAAAQISSNNEPCAVAAAGLARGGRPITAQVAYDCLNSVPVDVQGNSELIDELKNVWQFQSEIEWFKNPGQDWEYGPLDIEAELDNIKGRLGSFSSEYEVQLAIQNITVRTGNYHFNYSPDILQVFTFRRGFNVASISSDGKSLPKLYFYEDVAALAEGSSDASEISEINGQNPYDFLIANAYSQYIDTDGRLNSQFAHGDTETVGGFAQQQVYQGPDTNVTWANGTEASFVNVAMTDQDFSLVADGESFFRAFCTGGISGAPQASANTKTTSISPGRLGPIPRIPAGTYHRRGKRQTIPTGAYAEAVVEAESGVVAGYFLNGNGYSDVAVLKIISFSNPDNTDDTKFVTDFQSTVSSFLSECVSQKKQKLIIDLRENGGGSVDLLLDTFMQLFPDMEPFSGQRYRATEAFVKIGNLVDEIHSDSAKARDYARATGDNIEDSGQFRYWSWWHFRTAEGENFSGWDQFNGPLKLNNDEFTTTMRYNYSNSDDISIRTDGFFFTTDKKPQAFNTSNIVMYTDALCGSSCASFHEELKNIAGIKAVTVGGRPRNAPIQTVTGTKGGEVTSLMAFPSLAIAALNVSAAIDASSFKETDSTLSALANTPQIATRAGDSSTRAQSQDQVRKGDKTATPLQFIYEASDCKIFYTAETFADPVAAWKQAWDAFEDEGKCVEGSTGHKSSISGGFKPYGAVELKTEDQPDPAGSTGGDKANAASASRGLKFGSWGVVVGVMGVSAALL